MVDSQAFTFSILPIAALSKFAALAGVVSPRRPGPRNGQHIVVLPPDERAGSSDGIALDHRIRAPQDVDADLSAMADTVIHDPDRRAPQGLHPRWRFVRNILRSPALRLPNRRLTVNQIIYIVGLVVIVIAILSFFGLR